MDRFQYQMTVPVDIFTFFLSIGAPEEENEIFPFTAYPAYYRIGKLFPALTLMRSGLVSPYSECCIEEQYTLPRPPLKIPGRWLRVSQIGAYLPENIDKAGRIINPIPYREA